MTPEKIEQIANEIIDEWRDRSGSSIDAIRRVLTRHLADPEGTRVQVVVAVTGSGKKVVHTWGIDDFDNPAAAAARLVKILEDRIQSSAFIAGPCVIEAVIPHNKPIQAEVVK